MSTITHDDATLFKAALGHPLRTRILTAVATTGELSPLDLAEHLTEPLGNVSYHVRILAGAGLLEETRTVPRRGAVQHYYRAGKLDALHQALRWQLKGLVALLEIDPPM